MNIQTDSSIYLRREGNKPITNVPRSVIRHSPDGFEWGYGGSGPSDLALNILHYVTGGDMDVTNELYMKFKWDFIAYAPYEGLEMSVADILTWIEEQKRGAK